MLGFIKGHVISKYEETLQLIVRADCIGYEINVTRAFFDITEPNSEVELWLHTHAREDILMLYGFSSDTEKHFFRTLLGVSGLGPKTALSLLTQHGADRLVRLILNKDADEISEASGVGKKLAQRIVLDLTSKMEKYALTKPALALAHAAPAPLLSPLNQLREDLLSALTHLGYTPGQIKPALDKMFERDQVETLGFESCLKGALKDLSRHA